MSAIGYIQVHAYTSYAQFPLEDVAVSITTDDGTAIALRITDKSGKITPVEVPVPDRSESLSPDPSEQPYTNVNVHARLQGYEQVETEEVQVFAGIVTNQNLELIPLSELPGAWDQTAVFLTPPQNL